jgi:hypothetical protein
LDLSILKDEAHESLQIRKGNEWPKDVEKDNVAITPWDMINE